MKSYQDFGINIPDDSTGQITTVCPKCSAARKKKTDKCLSINADEGVWNCHHCGWTGTLKTKRREIVRQATRGDYSKPTWTAASGLPEKVVKYFKGRGISKEVLDLNDIQYREKEWFSSGEAGAILFPFKRNGETVNIKYRSGDKKFKQEKGAEKILYGLDSISGPSLIICEGEMDKLSFDEVGYDFCVSVPDGAPSPTSISYSSKFSFLDNCKKEIGAVTEFILAVDNDAPGQTLEYELARRLGFDRCLRVTFPEGCKDANDVLVKYGAESLRAVIGAAKPFPIKGVVSAMDTRAELLSLYENGLDRTYSTGWANVDEYYKVRPGEMCIITGYPGDGKSEFLDALMLNLAELHGWGFGVCSLENLPHARHVAKLIKKYTGMPFFEGYSERMDQGTLDEGLNYINEHFHFIAPEEVTLTNILNAAKSLIFQKGIRGLLIDPYNMLIHKRKAGITETEYISQFLAEARLFARKNDIALFIVAHPAKPAKDPKGGEPKAPGLYSISGSAHWANMADNGMSVFRPGDGSGVEIHIKKVRFQEVGQKGVASLDYKAISGKYEDAVRF